MSDYKVCDSCNNEKPLQKFRYSIRVPVGFSNICMTCEIEKEKKNKIESIQQEQEDMRNLEWERYYGIDGGVPSYFSFVAKEDMKKLMKRAEYYCSLRLPI